MQLQAENVLAAPAGERRGGAPEPRSPAHPVVFGVSCSPSAALDDDTLQVCCRLLPFVAGLLHVATALQPAKERCFLLGQQCTSPAGVRASAGAWDAQPNIGQLSSPQPPPHGMADQSESSFPNNSHQKWVRGAAAAADEPECGLGPKLPFTHA